MRASGSSLKFNSQQLLDFHFPLYLITSKFLYCVCVWCMVCVCVCVYGVYGACVCVCVCVWCVWCVCVCVCVCICVYGVYGACVCVCVCVYGVYGVCVCVCVCVWGGEERRESHLSLQCCLLTPWCPPESLVCVDSNIKCDGGQYDTQAQKTRNLSEREGE